MSCSRQFKCRLEFLTSSNLILTYSGGRMALIIKNQSRDPKSKTNLIVAPTALLDQWKLEIEMKTNCDLKCLIYHGLSSPSFLSSDT